MSYLIGLNIALAALPLLISLSTSYLKVNIVLNIIKNSLGAQSLPGPIIVASLSLAISFFVMQPLIEKIPEINIKKIDSFRTEIQPLINEWQKFLERNTNSQELEYLIQLNKGEKNLSTLILAFLLSELKEAFLIGLVIMTPFLLIDLAVASILTGMGMYMFSPVLVSLPLKILLIVSLDAWLEIFNGLILSYA